MSRPASPPSVAQAASPAAQEQQWLQRAQERMLCGDMQGARSVLEEGLAALPQSPELMLALAGASLQSGRAAEAEALLEALLARSPDHAAASFLLARLLREQGRMTAVAHALLSLFRNAHPDLEQRLDAIELLDDCGRQAEAASLCEAAIAAGAGDPRLYAHAVALAAQLGQFERARERQEFALSHDARAPEWHVPLGLAGLQRYRDGQHPDFARFAALLERGDLSAAARGSLLFALGKAHDDIGRYDLAARYLRQANAVVGAQVRWPRKLWRRSVEMRLERVMPAPLPASPTDWVPVFIVGMPRAGSTLLAEQLARYPDVRHRGELPWMPTLAARLAPLLADKDCAAAMQAAAATYAAQLRQDDTPARWYIDKQPHNFMHVDLILALFPQARIIHCRRDARDNALSLWMQSFHPGTQDFAFDFTDIDTAIRGSRRLMAHWQRRYPQAVYEVRYEDLVQDIEGSVGALAGWLGLPGTAPAAGTMDNRAISTASLWQARQPVHTRSLERWRQYAQWLPELANIADR
ncbi:MAG: tetratricopeptide repeat protein [Frateuria sp.]|nr:tetratricopeptide repeat protein [Frateuria sp.]